MTVGFAVFHMTNTVGVLKHRFESAVVEISIAGHYGIREIGQGVKIRMVDGLDHFHYEERVLADEIVILQIDDDILAGTILSYFPQTLRCALYMWG